MALTRRHVLRGGTVVLASVVAGCQGNRSQATPDLGNEVPDYPQVRFQFEFEDGGDGRILHDGGDLIEGPETLFVHVGEDWRAEWDGYPVQVGDEFDLGRYPADTWSGETVRVVWEAPDQDTSRVLGEATAPG